MVDAPPMLPAHYLTVYIKALSGWAVHVKMVVCSVDKYTLFSRYRIDVAALTALGIGTSRDQASIPRGLINFRWCFSRKVLRIDLRRPGGRKMVYRSAPALNPGFRSG
jgi:hypothetical protein